MLTYASETSTLTKRDKKQLNIFERKVYRVILGPVYDIENENWRILTNIEIYASVKNPTIIETIRLNRLCWFEHVQRMEENRIPKRVLYMNLGTTRLRGRPRNRWQDEVREDGRIVGGEGWQEQVHNREEWEKLLRTARNRHILHMPMRLISVPAEGKMSMHIALERCCQAFLGYRVEDLYQLEDCHVMYLTV